MIEMDGGDIRKKLIAPMKYKWKVQSTIKGNSPMCICVAYIDSRDCQNRLDDVFGIDGWKDRYYNIGNILFCEISIFNHTIKEWVTKTETGSESMAEKEKGHVSDCFKRACVKLGIGRFLYDLKIQKIGGKEYNGKIKPCDGKGNIIWDNDVLSDYINSIAMPPRKEIIEELLKIDQSGFSQMQIDWFVGIDNYSDTLLFTTLKKLKG